MWTANLKTRVYCGLCNVYGTILRFILLVMYVTLYTSDDTSSGGFDFSGQGPRCQDQTI